MTRDIDNVKPTIIHSKAFISDVTHKGLQGVELSNVDKISQASTLLLKQDNPTLYTQ